MKYKESKRVRIARAREWYDLKMKVIESRDKEKADEGKIRGHNSIISRCDAKMASFGVHDDIKESDLLP
jgi:hypothetical protein